MAGCMKRWERHFESSSENRWGAFGETRPPGALAGQTVFMMGVGITRLAGIEERRG